MKNTKILVTGGAGMIGSNLVKELVKLGNDVYVADNLWRGKLEYLNVDNKPCIDLENRFYNLDLSIPDELDPILCEVDYVVHLADIVAGIGFVFNNQGFIFRQNVLINSNVFNSVRKFSSNIKGVIYVGTACSFPLELQNSNDAQLLKESQLFPANPESAYGWSKLMGQFELDLLGKETDVKTVSLIFHNVYGSPTDYGERSQVIPSLIRKAVKYPEEEFIVWGSGNQGRAFVHVSDVVRAIVLALDKGWGHGVIQIGPSVCTSISELAHHVVKVSGKDIKIKFDITKPEGDKARAADFTKAAETLGWRPEKNHEEGIAELYDWVKRDYLVNQKL
jgi:GDP-D-mannose 3',5'-epimerase